MRYPSVSGGRGILLVDLVSELGELGVDQGGQYVALDANLGRQLLDETVAGGAAIGVEPVAVFQFATDRHDQALRLSARRRHLDFEGVAFGKRDFSGCDRRRCRFTNWLDLPSVRLPSVCNRLHNLLAPAWPAQHVADILAVALLELGRQHGDPHGLGDAPQNPRGKRAAFLAGSVPVGDQDHLGAGEEAGELRGQPARV